VNIAFVVHRYDAAEGTGGYVTQLLPRVARHHQVTLYAADIVTDPPPGTSIRRIPVPRRPTMARILTFPLVFAGVRGRHDVVHAQGYVAPSADVVTTHIVLAAWRAAAAPVGGLSRGERLFGAGVVGREKALVRGARAVITPSTAAQHDVARWYGRTDGVHVIPHGFTRRPGANRDRPRFGLPDGAFVALYVGDARKGLRPALEAVAGVPDARLLVVSHSAPGPWVGLARTLAVESRVTWAGPLADIEVPYGAADALLHPTIYDSFGLVVAEAMAAGLPVVVSPQAGICDLIRDGETGLVARTAEEARSALSRLATDRGLAARLAEAGRRTADLHTWDRTAEATLAVYAALERT
jgi:UDP-glucose:(heptosyl)LPS alpha-1,3-glucosyltransferase